MQDLKVIRGISTESPQQRATNSERDTNSNNINIQDLQEDVLELRYLVSDLDWTVQQESESSQHPAEYDSFCDGWFENNFAQGVHILKSRLRRLTEISQRAAKTTRHDHLVDAIFAARKEYLSLKSTLRMAYRQRGLLLNAADWQSPMYAATVASRPNRLSQGIAEHVLDYKRDGHLDASAYEEEFIKQYASHLGSDNLKAYLTNSGMAAFSTILTWLAHERRLSGTAVALQPMYFENIHLARNIFSDLVQLESLSAQRLLAQLRSLVPSIVFCDAVTNSGTVVSHDIHTILRWAATEARHEVAIVIDTTCYPLFLLQQGLLKDLPKNVSVIFIESLAKYHQFGMDTVTGGIIVAHAPQTQQTGLMKTRARFGTNITDSSVGSLPTPDKTALMRRMRRHARNTRFFVQCVERRLPAGANAIESISCLREEMHACPWYQSSCIVLHLHDAFQSVELYKQFENKVLELARERKLAVGLGTSFGFDITRLYVTAPSSVFEKPFLRISIGTETIHEIEELVDVVTLAGIQMREIWSESGTKVQQQPAPVIGETRRLDRVQIQKSVFVGDNALHNYLHPENYAPAPLVELPLDLNPLRGEGVRLFAKVMPLVPLMNIKSLPAYSMISEAAARGDLEGVSNLIESSSSNTVLSLSVIGRLFGIDNTKAIVDHSIAPALVNMLRLFGIEVMKHPSIGHELYGKLPPRSERASALGAQPGWYNPCQYGNPDNPEAFAKWLAPDLFNQTQGRLDVLSCGLGTCGTMVGVSAGLRKLNPNIQLISCCPQAGHAVPGPREQSLLKDVTFDWRNIADAKVELTAQESFAASIKLLRRGIMGGPSSGMNYAGLLQYLQQKKEDGTLAQMVDERGEIWSVFLCCDSPLPHVEEYFDALGSDYFPAVHPVPEADSALS